MPFQKTPEEIIATIKMLKASGVDIFILVEGNFDYIFWKNKKTPLNTIDIINCQGRKNVEIISDSELLNNCGLIIGITDRDYDHFFSPIERKNNLIYTDYNDLETTLLSFDISKDIIQKVCDLDKIRMDSICLDNPEEIFRESLLMGKLRYLSKKNHICFPFENRCPLGKY